MHTERVQGTVDTVPVQSRTSGDRVIGGVPMDDLIREQPVTGSSIGFVPAVSAVGHDVMVARNRVQWGPITAGIVLALAIMIWLTMLGVAVGASAFEPGVDLTDWSTAAGLWGAFTVLIAFFAGGWVAAKTAAVGGSGSGLINGLVTGAATLLLLFWMTTAGLTNAIGFLGTTVADVVAVEVDPATIDRAAEATTPATVEGATEQIEGAAETVRETAENVASNAETGAWGAAIAMLIALVAAALGGLTGYNKRHEVVTGAG